MYTIEQAALRTGISVPLLRAWERRYGVPTPDRSASGYRLYGDEAIAQLRAMRQLVDEGWAPSQAAIEVLAGRIPTRPAAAEGSPIGEGGPEAPRSAGSVERIVAAARSTTQRSRPPSPSPHWPWAPRPLMARLDRLFASVRTIRTEPRA
jgi:hypothetical protein